MRDAQAPGQAKQTDADRRVHARDLGGQDSRSATTQRKRATISNTHTKCTGGDSPRDSSTELAGDSAISDTNARARCVEPDAQRHVVGERRQLRVDERRRAARRA